MTEGEIFPQAAAPRGSPALPGAPARQIIYGAGRATTRLRALERSLLPRRKPAVAVVALHVYKDDLRISFARSIAERDVSLNESRIISAWIARFTNSGFNSFIFPSVTLTASG